jgi:phosphatidylglycerophosphate synthase
MDIFYKILLGLAAAFGVYWIFKTKKLVPSLISIGMIVAVVMVIFPSLALFGPGLYTYMAFVALAFIYGLAVKSKNFGERIVISLMSAPLFIYWLWVLNHWHGSVFWAPIIVILTALIGMITKAKVKNETGFLAILLADAITLILEIMIRSI